MDTTTGSRAAALRVQEISRLHSLDLLRGLAILGVVAVHATEFFPSHIALLDTASGLGRLGVQLFYYVSALTMCYMWFRREGEAHPIRNFYIRRVFRIAPLFWLAIPIYLIVNGMDVSYWAPEGVGFTQIFLTAIFLHGFWPNSMNSVVPGGWSIAVEMMFYTIFPFLILRIAHDRMIYLVAAFSIWVLNVLFIQDYLVYLLSNIYVTHSDTIVTNFLYMNFINQLPIFLLGMYLFFALADRPRASEIALLVLWLAIAAFLRIALHWDVDFLFAYMAIGCGVFGIMKANLKFGLLEAIGQKSYTIYLCHFAILNYLKMALNVEGNILIWAAMLAGTMLLSYLLSIVLHAGVEKPVQRLVNHITKVRIVAH